MVQKRVLVIWISVLRYCFEFRISCFGFTGPRGRGSSTPMGCFLTGRVLRAGSLYESPSMTADMIVFLSRPAESVKRDAVVFRPCLGWAPRDFARDRRGRHDKPSVRHAARVRDLTVAREHPHLCRLVTSMHQRCGLKLMIITALQRIPERSLNDERLAEPAQAV